MLAYSVNIKLQMGFKSVLTIFPCLFAIVNEMRVYTASADFQRLSIEVFQLQITTALASFSGGMPG
jgi:hypothetical protein